MEGAAAIARSSDQPLTRSPGTGVRIAFFLLAAGGSGLLFLVGFPPAAPDRLPVVRQLPATQYFRLTRHSNQPTKPLYSMALPPSSQHNLGAGMH